MTNAIEVKHIFLKYQNKPILKDICFNVKEGEIVALIGKNGAGKSTLINIINGLIKPNSGQCMIYNQTKPDRNLMGLMLQDNFSLDRVKVKEAIQLARTYYQHPLSYEKILAISGLSTKQNNFMTQLSGGQKRSLQFALAMVGNPKIIFLDEPTSGMDPDARTHFWKYIDELKKQGKTFLITSHYLNELEILSALKEYPTTKELAKHLFLSEGTVRNYISSILSKTGTSSRLEAVSLAEKRHWI